MKTPPLLFLAACVALLGGCASAGSGLVLDPVGPSPASRPLAAASGALKVFSAFETNAPAPGDPDSRQYHMDYRILSAAGQFRQTVHNDAGWTVAEPATVELPPGDYRVVARANGYGVVTVPVLISPGQITIVHLEGGAAPPQGPAAAAADAVRLPDGRVVGWRVPAPAGS